MEYLKSKIVIQCNNVSMYVDVDNIIIIVSECKYVFQDTRN